jgi:HSP20 family protein
MFRSMMPFGRSTPTQREQDPFVALQREMNRLFDDVLRGVPRAAAAAERPAPAFPLDIDVKETPSEYVLTADLPGIDQQDLDVTLVGDTLTIKGERKAEKTEKGETWQLMERSYGTFYRALTLPFAADAEKVQAGFDKGVLTIRVPKPAETAAAERKIPIAEPGKPARAA